MSKNINSISDLIEILKIDFAIFSEDIWFRGQSNFDWKLQLVQASQTIKTLLDKTLKCTVKHLWKRLLSFLSEREIIESELIDLVSRKFQIRLI